MTTETDIKAGNETFGDIPKQPIIDELANALRRGGIHESIVRNTAFQKTNDSDVYNILSVVKGHVIRGAIKCFDFNPVYAFRFLDVPLMGQINPMHKGVWAPKYQLHLNPENNLYFRLDKAGYYKQMMTWMLEELEKDAELQDTIKAAQATVQQTPDSLQVFFLKQRYAGNFIDFVNANFKLKTAEA